MATKMTPEQLAAVRADREAQTMGYSNAAEYAAAQAKESERLTRLVAATAASNSGSAGASSGALYDKLVEGLGGNKERAAELLFNAKNPELAGKVNYRDTNIIDVAKADGSLNPDGTIATEKRVVGGTMSNLTDSSGRKMGVGQAIEGGFLPGVKAATSQDMAPKKSRFAQEREAYETQQANQRAMDLRSSQQAHADWLEGAGKTQNEAFRQELIRNGGVTDADVAERNANLAKMGLPPFQPTPMKDWTTGMKRGGPVQQKAMGKAPQKKEVKAFAKGGLVKGSGCATRGVKKLRML